MAQLERILYVLPRGARPEGVSTRAVAEELGVTPRQIRTDMDLVNERAFYLPPEASSQLSVTFQGDLLRVHTTRDFARPTKLTPREAVGVALALRMCMARTDADAFERERLAELTVRLEEQARRGKTEQPPESAGFPVEVEAVDPRDDVRNVVLAAHRTRTRCRIQYLSDNDASPLRRVVRPYLLAHGDGRWYVVGYCEAREALRTFRFDRILEAEATEDGFEIDPDFDPQAFTKDGKVHDGQFEESVVVHYSSTIARWVAERWEGESGDDDSYVVEHPVSNPRWLVQHVLGYGGEAVVRGPERYRVLVREAAEGASG